MNSEAQFKYGKNNDIGRFANINGIWMYYEIYGEGEPLFIIHGNGSSIAGLEFQIKHFQKNFQVIVADSRGHGQSEMNTIHLTYTQMADDYLCLMDHLEIKSAKVLGWSDGGNIAILMAIKSPARITALMTMGSNTRPPEEAIIKLQGSMIGNAIQEAERKVYEGSNPDFWNRKWQQLQLLRGQPEIEWKELNNITCPSLVMAGEKDSVKREHTLKIAESIPKGHVCIFSGEDHYMPVSNPERFNAKISEFLTALV